MNYPEVLDFLYNCLPNFQKVGNIAIKLGLKNIELLCEHLDNPHTKFPSIHIAGTNGKGSTSHTIAAILQSAGYKVGLYTSPHLKSFTERIRINGIEISEEKVIQFTENNFAKIQEIEPSFFEITVAMAFEYFADEEVDIAVIEVGMGGRLDSTNIISPLLSIITNISYDHQQFLGDTLPLIASEKAGIIKWQTPVVISETQAETANVFIEKAQAMQADVYFAEENYQIVENTSEDFALNIFKNKQLFFDKIIPSLKGNYQIKNLKGILQAIEILQKMGWKIDSSHIQIGIENVSKATGLKGRWQILNQRPLTICDTAHNEAGIMEVLHQINTTPHKRLHIIFGFTKDKDIKKILKLYPSNAFYYFCQYNGFRALEVEVLEKEAQRFGLIGQSFAGVNEAIFAANQKAETDDLIYVGGSTFVVAEIEGL